MSVKTPLKNKKDKILIVERQFIHTHFNEYQRLILPPSLSFKALKVAFYLLHYNQLINHINKTNDIKVCRLSMSDLCCYFETSKKVMLAIVESLNHPLIEMVSVDNSGVSYTVDRAALCPKKAVINDEHTTSSYFIDLDKMKPHRSIIGWMMGNFKAFYGQKVKLNRTFLFDFFGYACETEKQRKDAVRSIKRAAKSQGYEYQKYCFVPTQQIELDDYAIHLSQLYSEQEQEQEIDLRSISDYEAYYGQL